MVRFDDVLTVKPDGHVVASGPVESSREKIIELCAWVFQRGDRTDAAVTEMTHEDENGESHLFHGEGELTVMGDHWSMELGRVGTEPMASGQDAFAVAVAMIEDKDNGRQEVVWWGHPVKLADEAA
jgi:hypothetical protein